MNGYPYESVGKNAKVQVFYNMKTGAPGLQHEYLYNEKGKHIGTECTRFGNDGKTIISKETQLYSSPFSKSVREFAPDGSYTVKKYAKDNSESLVSLEKYSKEGTPIRKIKLHEGTKQPAVIKDYDKQGSSRTQMFDIDGKLTCEF